jgi:polyhydroxyalkanoate synthesis repressor PhaR
MPIIKRYANRKLYDTEAKKYISLESIAEMIRQGSDVQVVDNVTGNDITALTLSQIILEQEKKRDGFVPRPILTTLVEAGGRSIGYLHEKLEPHFKHLGEMEVDEKIERRIQDLIQRGEIAEEAGLKLLAQLREKAISWSSALPTDDTLLQILVEKKLPKRYEFQGLIDQIDSLSEKLDRFGPDE